MVKQKSIDSSGKCATETKILNKSFFRPVVSFFADNWFGVVDIIWNFGKKKAYTLRMKIRWPIRFYFMMEVDPVLKLDVQIDAINSHVCLLCQLKSNEALVVCPKQVDRIIKCLESLECLEIGHYEDINKRIGRTEARIRNKMSYHITT